MSTRFCPNDKSHFVSSSDNFCENCGAKISTSKCSNGHEIYNSKANFCWSCGVRLDKLSALGNEIPTRQPAEEIDREDRAVRE